MVWLMCKIVGIVFAIEFIKEIKVSIEALRNNEDKGILTGIFKDVICAIRNLVRSVLGVIQASCSGVARLLSGNRETTNKKKED